MRRKLESLVGLKFHRLTVIGFARRDDHRNIYWTCRCRCGGESVVQSGALKNGHIKSCGCLHDELSKKRCAVLGRNNLKHGDARNDKKPPEYTTWTGIKNRTLNPHSKDWPNYGGRGIKLCTEWKLSYSAFLRDMGRRPSALHSIDRVNNNGHYEPSNCRWSTAKEQANNRRSNRG